MSLIPKEKNALFRQLDEESRKEFIAEMLARRKAEELKADQEKSKADSPQFNFAKKKHLAERDALITKDNESQSSEGPPVLCDSSSISTNESRESGTSNETSSTPESGSDPGSSLDLSGIRNHCRNQTSSIPSLNGKGKGTTSFTATSKGQSRNLTKRKKK